MILIVMKNGCGCSTDVPQKVLLQMKVVRWKLSKRRRVPDSECSTDISQLKYLSALE